MPADEDFTQLNSERILLRRFRSEDLDAFVAYRSDASVSALQPWENYSPLDGIEFLAQQSAIHPGSPGEWFQLAIESKETGGLVGDVAMHVSDDDPLQVEIGFSMATDHQGLGYATEAVETLLDYLFRDLRKHRAFAITDVSNARAIELLERVGFRREGTFVDAVRFKRRWASEHLYAMLRREWLPDEEPER